MPWCPVCKTEYRQSFCSCIDCGIDLVDALQPDVEQEAKPETNEPWVFFAEIHDYTEAVIIESLLQSNMVPFSKEYKGDRDVMGIYVGNTTFSVDLFVPESQFTQAEELLGSNTGFRGNQDELNELADRECKRADDKLNESYNQIFVKFKNNKLFLDKFGDAEIAWIKFRDAHLAALYPEEDKILHYGSMFPLAYYFEKANLTWDRVMQLNQWLLDYPEGMAELGSRGKTYR